MIYDEFRAMNSDIVLAAEGSPSEVRTGFQLARQYIEASEKRFTRFSDSSELSQLNRSAGSWFKASPQLFELIVQSLVLMARTAGLFDPAILPALKKAGYDQSMDILRKEGPKASSSSIQVEKQDFHKVRLDPATRSIWMPPGMQIDLGGIAKGWIAEQAAGLLKQHSTACTVSAGGDMFVIGLPEGETSWPIGLENPLDPDQDLAVLHVQPGAIATSSIAKRKWLQDGQIQHHLIDPRTGKPAETDWLSVTVTAPHAAEAEVFAKALLIAGSKGAHKVLFDSQKMAYIAVDKYGKLWGQINPLEMTYVELEHA